MSRIVALLGRARTLALHPRLRPWLLGATALLFLALAAGSFASLPEDGRGARPELVAVLILVTAPATLLLNALEYRFMANTLGHSITLRHAFRVSLIASIANYLPAPGGVAVRTAALRQRGSTVRAALSINLLAGLVWLGVTGLIAGLAIVASDHSLAGRGAASAAAGTALLTAGVVLMARTGSGWTVRLRTITLIETSLVLVAGTRMFIGLAAIGQSASFGSSVAIASSGVFAALLGVFPAGLGLREVLAGGIATAVGVKPAAAVAATAVDRVCSQVGMGLTALATGVRRSDLAASPTPSDPAVVGGDDEHGESTDDRSGRSPAPADLATRADVRAPAVGARPGAGGGSGPDGADC